MIYLRLTFIFFWLAFSCVLGLFACLVRWGDPSLNRTFSHLFAWGTLKISGIDVRLEGAEHLDAHQPCIYVANHQSGFDLAVFGKIYPGRALVIGKTELKWIPFFGLFFAAAGNISIKRQKRVKAIKGLGVAVEAIKKRDVSIWIFPEGTRNGGADSMLPFKKGAFYMAIEAGVPIVPVVCSPLLPIIDWKKKSLRPGQVTVRVLPPVPTTGMKVEDVDALSEKTRDVMMEALRGLVTRVSA